MAFSWVWSFNPAVTGGEGIAFDVEFDIISAADSSAVVFSTDVRRVRFRGLEQTSPYSPTGEVVVFNPGSTKDVALTQDTCFISAYQLPSLPSGPSEYVNWRTGEKTRHPISGEYSFDWWPDVSAINDPIYNILTFSTFADITGTFNLNPNKWTVFYDYTAPRALGYARGGSVQISVTTPPIDGSA